VKYVYRLEYLEFEWDTHKADNNLDKHGVDFAEATIVFFDEYRMVTLLLAKRHANL